MGRPPTIDRAAVLTAGLAVADQQGLDALTMQAVARRLGVTAMALYRHVESKSDLLDGLLELLMAEFTAPGLGACLPDQFAAVSASVRACAKRHPHVFPLLMQRPASTPDARRYRDCLTRALRDAGVARRELARTERLISTAILGFAASEAGGRFTHHSQRELDRDFARLQELLLQFIESQLPIEPARLDSDHLKPKTTPAKPR